MLGKQSDQRGLWEADSLYIDHVGRGSFYGLLASLRGQLFRDEEFGELYCDDNGRESVPPSLLATALLLQTYDRVSDAESKQRADFDKRWKVALGIEVNDSPFAKSTLQLFRARLILHKKAREVFERSLRFAKETGYLKRRRMKVALDTTYILGRGAVKDTYNLLADGIVKLMRGEYRQRRVVVEHRLARLVQLGVRQARYFGRTKTLFQLLMAAAVANLTLVAGRVGMMGKAVAGPHSPDISLALISTTWSDDAGIG